MTDNAAVEVLNTASAPSPSLPEGSHLTWAAGWMVEPDPTGAGAFRLCIWRTAPPTGTPLIWFHDDRVLWVYFGAQHPRLISPEVLTPSWIERIFVDPDGARMLPGVFAFLAIDLTRGRLVAAGDTLGVQGVYYTSRGEGLARVATHLTWLLLASNHDGTVDDDMFFAHMAYGYVASAGHTVYEGIQRLPPAGYLRAKDNRFAVTHYWSAAPYRAAPHVEDLAQILRQGIQAWPADEGVFLPLTAGKDSLCLASVTSTNRGLRTGTLGLAKSSDRIQGRQVSDALGTTHADADVCRATALPTWVRHIAFHSAGLATSSYVDLARFVSRHVPRGWPLVIGEGGECVRDFFRGPGGPVETLSREYMTPADYLQQCLEPRFTSALDGYPGRLVQETREASGQAGEEAFALYFYRHQRMPGNFSQRHSFLAPLRAKLSPLLDPRFIDGAYGLPRRWFERSALHRAVIEVARPGLLPFFDQPYSSKTTTQGWTNRWRGAAGRTVAQSLRADLDWSRDVFSLEGVEELLRATTRQPGRAVYHLLRVLSFVVARRILRSEAAEQLTRIREETSEITAFVRREMAAQGELGSVPPTLRRT